LIPTSSLLELYFEYSWSTRLIHVQYQSRTVSHMMARLSN